MKKETKKILALSILGLFMFSVLASLVLAQTDTSTTERIRSVKEFFSGLFSEAGDSTTFPKILFFILVMLIVYAISDLIPFLEGANPWLRMGVSVIIGILSIFYLAPEEIYTMMMGYKTMGIVLGAAIPFIVFLVVTIRWNEKRPEYTIVSSILWIAFIVIMAFNYIGQLFACWTPIIPEEECKMGFFGSIVIPIIFLASFLMAIFGGRISRAILLRKLKSGKRFGKVLDVAERDAQIRKYNALMISFPEAKDVFQAEINKLNKLTFRP